jgi:hypothetical protein
MEERVDRGDVDDRAFAALGHVGDGGARRAQGGEEVELQRCLEVGVGGAEEAVESQVDAAHVVDEDVDPAVQVHGMGDEPSGTVGFDQVDGQRRDALETLERADAARSGDDLGALRGQLARHGQADALARTGDHDDLVVEFEVHAGECISRPRTLAGPS